MKNFSIRLATISDLPDLLDLEQACWPLHLRLSENRINKRIKNYPDGQFVVMDEKRVVGCLYTQRIKNITELEQIKFSCVESLHSPSGKYLQLLSINIHLNYQKEGLGNKLRNFALNHAQTSAMISVVGVTRCLKYDNTLSYYDYIKKEKDGLPIDPILRFHVGGGAYIRSILENFRPEDVANLGYGVLIEYTRGC